MKVSVELEIADEVAAAIRLSEDEAREWVLEWVRAGVANELDYQEHARQRDLAHDRRVAHYLVGGARWEGERVGLLQLTILRVLADHGDLRTTELTERVNARLGTDPDRRRDAVAVAAAGLRLERRGFVKRSIQAPPGRRRVSRWVLQ